MVEVCERSSVRLSYAWDDTESKLKVIEENHYYPFGLKHTGYNDLTLGVEIVNSNDVRVGIGVVNMQTSGSDSYNYKYNGKELQNELGLDWYAMDMRMYDPAIARWMVQDPVVHHSMSPYNAFDNNPVFWADPSGADATSLIQELWDNTPEGTNSFWVNTTDEKGDSVDNDHFDKNGKFLYTDNEKEQDILIHTDKGIIKFGEFQVKSEADAVVSSNILNYYYKLMYGSEINNLKNNSLSIFSALVHYAGGNPDKLENPIRFNSPRDTPSSDGRSNTSYYPNFSVTYGNNTITAFFTNNHTMGTIFNQKWNLMSSLSHEYGHFNNKDSEAKAYLIQTINPIFIFATPEYKKIIYDQSKRYGLPK